MARHHAVLRAAAPDKAIEPCTARCGRTGKAGSGKVEREDELKSGKPSRTGEGGTRKKKSVVYNCVCAGPGCEISGQVVQTLCSLAPGNLQATRPTHTPPPPCPSFPSTPLLPSGRGYGKRSAALTAPTSRNSNSGRASLWCHGLPCPRGACWGYGNGPEKRPKDSLRN